MKTDNTSTEITPISSATMPDALDKLIVRREHWEQNELLRSNERLYEILADCYKMCWRMNATTHAAQSLKLHFKVYCDQRGFNFKSNTHLTVRMVQVVFGLGDRRRVSAYGAVLKTALLSKVQPESFVDFIKTEGGIENVRRTGGKKKVTIKQKAEQGLTALESPELAILENEALSQQFDATSDRPVVLLVATREDDGKFFIRRMLQNPAAVNTALAALSKTAMEEQAERDETTKRLNEEEARNKAINDAVTHAEAA